LNALRYTQTTTAYQNSSLTPTHEGAARGFTMCWPKDLTPEACAVYDRMRALPPRLPALTPRTAS
jgi:hypothetical protein